MRNAVFLLVLPSVSACHPAGTFAEGFDSEVASRLSDNWADQDTNDLGTHRVTADVLNVRNAAGAVIDTALFGQQLVITGTTRVEGATTFYEAVFKGGALADSNGWVAGQYLSYSELEVCSDGVNVRTGATLGTVIGTVGQGDRLYVTSGTIRNTGSHRYFEGSVDGLRGWVATDYLCPVGGSGTPGDAAGTVLDYHGQGVTVLWDQTFGRFDGASPLDNIEDAAAGRPALTSCYGTAPCDEVYLDDDLLAGMVDLVDEYGYSYFVTTIAGASHSTGSLHYDGRAFDVDEIDGTRIFGDSTLARGFMDACVALGAIEVFGPSNDPYGHSDHIHCAW